MIVKVCVNQPGQPFSSLQGLSLYSGFMLFLFTTSVETLVLSKGRPPACAGAEGTARESLHHTLVFLFNPLCAKDLYRRSQTPRSGTALYHLPPVVAKHLLRLTTARGAAH